jgi:hypothetical protein
MKVDEKAFESWPEALQDLLIDVAAAVDATESDRQLNRNVLGGASVASLRDLCSGGGRSQQRE